METWKTGKRRETRHSLQAEMQRGGEEEREAEIWKPRNRRTVLKTTGNTCMQFSAFFPRNVFLVLWIRHIRALWQGLVSLKNSKGTRGKSQQRECVQTGMDLQVGGLIPRFPEKRRVQSEQKS